MSSQDEQILGDRILALLGKGTTQLAEREYLQPVSAYTSAAHLAKEREHVFRRQPLVVCAASELAGEGDFRTVDVDGISALITRQSDGSLRAFHNVCRHRGTRVVSAAGGCQRLFSCPYHAWVYGADGSLRHIPAEEGFAGLDRRQLGLVPLPVHERFGLVWLGPTEGGATDMDAFLAPAADLLSRMAIDKAALFRRESYTLQFNWKLVIETFLEGYHIKHLHKSTIGRLVESDGCVSRPLGPHGLFCVAMKSWQKIRELPSERRDFRKHVNIVLRLFPNTIVFWLHDHAEMYVAMPAGDDPGRCVVTQYMFSSGPQMPEAETAGWEKRWRLACATTREEDFLMAETMQRGFSSGAQNSIRFGRNEPALHDFHESLRAAVGQA